MNTKDTSVKTKDILLFFDPLKAHGTYVKKMLASQGRDHKAIHTIHDIEDVYKHIQSFNVTTVVLFIYSREGLYRLLPFVNMEINCILCTDAREIGWLNYYLEDIKIIDLGLPKQELFSQIETEISGF
ncbi:hypothetical protein WIW50_18725 [Flavobacteriaceae bacterium 3-367]|uniref:hypothetical protein n=1 Tax=Eudoraea algarum TaxID=3417568 RepID=UPI00326E0E5B